MLRNQSLTKPKQDLETTLFKKQKHCRNLVDCLIKGTLGRFISYLQTLKGRVCYVEEKVPYYWLKIKDRKYNSHSHVHL